MFLWSAKLMSASFVQSLSSPNNIEFDSSSSSESVVPKCWTKKDWKVIGRKIEIRHYSSTKSNILNTNVTLFIIVVLVKMTVWNVQNERDDLGSFRCRFRCCSFVRSESAASVRFRPLQTISFNIIFTTVESARIGIRKIMK